MTLMVQLIRVGFVLKFVILTLRPECECLPKVLLENQLSIQETHLGSKKEKSEELSLSLSYGHSGCFLIQCLHS